MWSALAGVWFDDQGQSGKDKWLQITNTNDTSVEKSFFPESELPEMVEERT